MAGEWQTLSLREAGVSLTDCDHRTPPAAESGYPYVAIPQLRDGRIELKEARKITREHFIEWTRKANPTANDVVLSRRCNPGETAFVPPDVQFALGQNLVLLRSDGTQVYPPFLRWLTRGPGWWDQINTFINVGAVFDSLKCADIPRFELMIPPLDEQRAIAHILGTLDDKIELNRRMNETLEAIARAMFKSLFVDFDPVRAKMDGEPPASICRRLGLTPDLLALFPDRLVDSELGEIPEGWGISPVYEIATYINGAAYKAFEPNDVKRGLPIIKIAELKAGITEQTKYSEVEMPDKFRINRGDILFSWSGNPDTSIDTFIWANEPAWLNQHIFRVVPLSSLERPFLIVMLKYLRPVFAEMARNKQTTGLGHVTVSDLKRLKCVRPPKSLLFSWNEVIEPILERAFLTELETQSLANHRDTLLPKLLSGELRVPDAANLIAEATT